jgi:phosphoribosylformimino-5-aminoimidazole carboxamide ribotide isomerase
MELYARVNILDGRAVRLERGDLSAVTALDADPIGRAHGWVDKGVDYLHIVDLDAAATGDYRNRGLIDQILRELEVPVVVGGGIRSEGEAERLIRAGAWKIVMGTAAIEHQNMVWDLCRVHPGRIIVSLDVLDDEQLLVHGWTTNSGRYLEEVLVEMAAAGVWGFFVSEGRRDALTEPPDFEILTEALGYVDLPIIAAGGVRHLDDLRHLMDLENAEHRLAGVVVGREVTEGRFTIEQAQSVLSGEAGALAERVRQMRLVLRVSDLEVATDFYENTLSLRNVRSWDDGTGAGCVLEAADGRLVELRDGGNGIRGVEISFMVDDIERTASRLEDHGARVTGPSPDGSGGRQLAVSDPDGVRITFFQRGP